MLAFVLDCFDGFEVLGFGGESEFAQEVLFFRNLVFQEADVVVGQFLDDLVTVEQLLFLRTLL